MNDAKYIGLDVHQATISVAVLDSVGSLVMEAILETKAETILQFIHGLRGSLHVTLEEGTCAAWLHDLLKPHVAQVLVCEQQAALAQKQAAEAEAEKARQAAAKAEAEKADMRAQLLAQLNSILQTNDSARGLIVNMSDVLFDTGSFTLKPGAREKLAKVSGILLAHPGLIMQIEGHTDSVGGDAFNVKLSEQRADSVKDFLGEQGVSLSSITAQGFGKAEPVATNDTAEGQQRNRRVEIVVNGDSIGTSTTATARPSNQNLSPASSTNLPREEESRPEK
jgi:outer membrane protein OmpA-like peptidoglycan-associated protein